MASTNVGSIHYDLDLDTSKFDRAMSGIASKTQEIGSRMTDVGKKMTVGLTLPIVAGAGFAIKAASDLTETINKVNVAFGDSSETVRNWSKNSIKSMGLAQQSALDAAALFGDMSTSMGLSQQEASKMSMSLVQLGADLSSFKNIPFEQAQTALAGIFTGETESLKRLGIVMTETNLEQFAMTQGITKSMQEMSQAEKVNLRYAYVMSVTSNAQGDFARTSDGAANKTRMTQERIKQLSADLGAKLMPMYQKLLEIGNKILDWFNKLNPEQQKTIMIVLGIVAAIGPLLLVLGTMLKGITALVTVFKLLTSGIGMVIKVLNVMRLVVMTNPILLLIAAIAAAAYLIISNWDTVKNFFVQLWWGIQSVFQAFINWLKENWMLILPIVFGPLGLLAAGIIRHWDQIWAFLQTLPSRIMSFFSGIGSWLYNAGRSLVQGIINGFQSMGGALWGGLSATFAAIGNFFGGAWHWLYDAGRAVVQGFIDGIRNMIGAISSAAGNIGEAVKNKVKGVLGIRSPSKVFKEFGMNVTEGFVQGLDKGGSMLTRAVDSMAGIALNPTISPIATTQGMGAARGMTIYGNINIDNKNDANYFFKRANRNQDLLSMGLAASGDES